MGGKKHKVTKFPVGIPDSPPNRLPMEKLHYYMEELIIHYEEGQESIRELMIENGVPINDYSISTVMLSAAHTIFVTSLVSGVRREELQSRVEQIKSLLYNQVLEVLESIDERKRAFN